MAAFSAPPDAFPQSMQTNASTAVASAASCSAVTVAAATAVSSAAAAVTASAAASAAAASVASLRRACVSIAAAKRNIAPRRFRHTPEHQQSERNRYEGYSTSCKQPHLNPCAGALDLSWR